MLVSGVKTRGVRPLLVGQHKISTMHLCSVDDRQYEWVLGSVTQAVLTYSSTTGKNMSVEQLIFVVVL